MNNLTFWQTLWLGLAMSIPIITILIILILRILTTKAADYWNETTSAGHLGDIE